MARAVDLATLTPEAAAAAVAHVATNLRKEDFEEVTASSGRRPELVIAEGVALSTRAWVILDRTGLPIGVFGVAPGPLPDIGIAWMLGTDGILDERLSIGRQTRRFVEEMHELYPVLTNMIDARNSVSLDWLLRGGFHLTDADPAFGPERRLFFEFSRTANV